VDLSKLSREDVMVGAGGIVLIIGLLAFPWFSVSVGPLSITAVSTDGGNGFLAVLALIVLIAVVGDLVLARFSPTTMLPTTQLGREKTRAAGAALAGLLLLIRFIADTGNLGWGFYINIILMIVVVAGAWLNAQGRSTPVASGSAS